MDGIRCSVKLVEPQSIDPGTSIDVALQYTNQNRTLSHHICSLSISPTWNLSRPSTYDVDYTVPEKEQKRLLDVELPTPPGLGGQQGFDVSLEVSATTGDGEMITEQQNTILLVPVADAPLYQTVICTAGTDGPPLSVQNLLRNWGFDTHTANNVQEVEKRFDEVGDTPTCFVGVLPASSADGRGKQLVSSAAWVADKHDVMSFIFTDETVTLSNFPPLTATFSTELTDERLLLRECGPTFLTVRQSFYTGQWEAVAEWLREKANQAKHEPKELLRALAYSLLLEKSGVREDVIELIDEIPESLATGLTKTTTTTAIQWPMFRVDCARTGSSDQRGPKDNITKQWTVETGDRVESSPAVVDGTVYVGSDDRKVYALDAETGRKRWTVEIGGVTSSPAVVDGTVYVGNWDHKVYALTEA